MIVVIEGVDAAGKSTLCKNLAERCSGIVYPTPPERIKRFRKAIDRFSNPQESLRYYSHGLEIAAEEIESLSDEYKYVFIDRHWISTAATHLAMGVDVPIDRLAKFDCADFTILLTISRREQLRRLLETRLMSSGDKKLLSLFDVTNSLFRDIVGRKCFPSLVLDTSDISEQETLRRVLSFLRLSVHDSIVTLEVRR